MSIAIISWLIFIAGLLYLELLFAKIKEKEIGIIFNKIFVILKDVAYNLRNIRSRKFIKISEKINYREIIDLLILFYPLIFFIFYIIYSFYPFIYLIYIFSSISIILFYFYPKKIDQLFIFFPLLMYPDIYLFNLSLFFIIISQLDLWYITPLSFILYSLILFSYFSFFKSLLFYLLPYFIVILLKLLIEREGREKLLKYIGVITLFGISLAILYLPDIYQLILVILSIILILKFKWDERIPIVIAIISLIIGAISLYKGYNDFANLLGILSYWELIVGVISAFVNSNRNKDKKLSES